MQSVLKYAGLVLDFLSSMIIHFIFQKGLLAIWYRLFVMWIESWIWFSKKYLAVDIPFSSCHGVKEILQSRVEGSKAIFRAWDSLFCFVQVVAL